MGNEVEPLMVSNTAPPPRRVDLPATYAALTQWVQDYDPYTEFCLNLKGKKGKPVPNVVYRKMTMRRNPTPLPMSIWDLRPSRPPPAPRPETELSADKFLFLLRVASAYRRSGDYAFFAKTLGDAVAAIPEPRRERQAMRAINLMKAAEKVALRELDELTTRLQPPKHWIEITDLQDTKPRYRYIWKTR